MLLRAQAEVRGRGRRCSKRDVRIPHACLQPREPSPDRAQSLRGSQQNIRSAAGSMIAQRGPSSRCSSARRSALCAAARSTRPAVPAQRAWPLSPHAPNATAFRSPRAAGCVSCPAAQRSHRRPLGLLAGQTPSRALLQMLGRRRDKLRRCVDCHLTHKPFLFAGQRSARVSCGSPSTPLIGPASAVPSYIIASFARRCARAPAREPRTPGCPKKRSRALSRPPSRPPPDRLPSPASAGPNLS